MMRRVEVRGRGPATGRQKRPAQQIVALDDGDAFGD